MGHVEIQRDGHVADLLLTYVSGQVQVIKDQERLVRHGEPDSVHQMRVAMRRLRSVLATYGVLLDIDLVDHLRGELKWLGLILGAERDAEVMRQRLTELVGSEPTERVAESAARHLREQLDANFSAAHREVLGALGAERYLQLVNDLDALLSDPPLTSFAYEPIKKIVPNLVGEDWRRLRRAVAVLKEVCVDHESALHEIRKRAKRLRYASETAQLVDYEGASRSANAAAGVQTILGDYHDSIVARDLIRKMCEQSGAEEANKFFFEQLISREECQAESSEIAFRKAWKRFPPGSLQ